MLDFVRPFYCEFLGSLNVILFSEMRLRDRDNNEPEWGMYLEI